MSNFPADSLSLACQRLLTYHDFLIVEWKRSYVEIFRRFAYIECQHFLTCQQSRDGWTQAKLCRNFSLIRFRLLSNASWFVNIVEQLNESESILNFVTYLFALCANVYWLVNSDGIAEFRPSYVKICPRFAFAWLLQWLNGEFLSMSITADWCERHGDASCTFRPVRWPAYGMPLS